MHMLFKIYIRYVGEILKVMRLFVLIVIYSIARIIRELILIDRCSIASIGTHHIASIIKFKPIYLHGL